MRPHALLFLGLALTIVAPLSAAPPKEERILIESGYGAFYSPDGKWLAFKSDLLKLGVMPTTRNARPIFDGGLSYGAFTADSKFMVAVDEGGKKVHFITLTTGRPARTIPIPFKKDNDIVQGIAVSNDAKKIVVSSLLTNPMVVDAVKGTKIADLEKCFAYRFQFSKDDKTVMGYDGNGQICTWEADTGKQTNAWAVGKRGLDHGVFSSDGKLAAAGEQDTGVVRLWDMVEAKEIGSLQNLKVIKSIDITKDGKTLAVACTESKKHEVRLWDVATQKELDGIKDLPTRVLSVSFSPDGKFLVVVTERSLDSKTKAATRLYSLP